jgi:hypothetical protein
MNTILVSGPIANKPCLSNRDEAIAGVENIMVRYSDHAARRIAEDYFESNRVLGNLLSQIL